MDFTNHALKSEICSVKYISQMPSRRWSLARKCYPFSEIRVERTLHTKPLHFLQRTPEFQCLTEIHPEQIFEIGDLELAGL
jgi:hypothetical protein